jgi:hypothetical protein
MMAAAFAERARRELLATGETVRKHYLAGRTVTLIDASPAGGDVLAGMVAGRLPGAAGRGWRLIFRPVALSLRRVGGTYTGEG